VVPVARVAQQLDQDVERQPRFLDVMADCVARLRDDADDLDAARGEFIGMTRELAKLAAAVWSPRAAMKDQQQPSVREQIHQRAYMSLLIGQREPRRDDQR